MSSISEAMWDYLQDFETAEESPRIVDVQRHIVGNGHTSNLLVQYFAAEDLYDKTPEAATLFVVGLENVQKVMNFARSLDPALLKGFDNDTALMWGAQVEKKPEEMN